MTFTIPTWLLWTLGLLVGVPAVAVLLTLAVVGFVMMRALSKNGFWR